MPAERPSYGVVLITGTTDASGDATVYHKGDPSLVGEIVSVLVDGVALTDSANLVLSEELTSAADAAILGPTIVNHADIGNATLTEIVPTQGVMDNAGTARLYAAGGTVVPTFFALHGGRLKAVISAGGNAKAFKIWVTIRS